MKQKTIHLNKEILQEIYEESNKHCASVQYLIDTASARLRNEELSIGMRENARISYCIAKAYQDVGDRWYDGAIQRLESAIEGIKREYLNEEKE